MQAASKKQKNAYYKESVSPLEFALNKFNGKMRSVN
ncbi:Uncharacterised protein [Chlamydia trachomatis]|nr:Uncharacterised protein [Chlamydia trachomatis]